MDALSEGTRPRLATFKAPALNYMAALGVLGLAYVVYMGHPFFTRFYSDAQRQLFSYLIWAYVVLLPLYYLTLPPEYVAKCRLFWRACFTVGKRRPTAPEKTALLAVVIKLYFLPMMVMWLGHHSQEILTQGRQFWQTFEFFPHGYWLLLNLLFWVDVVCFTIGYAIEHPRLGNEIRSAEPTIAGWLVTLACYPPFNETTQTLLGWYSSDYPAFAQSWAQILAASVILLLMTVYAWASLALALRASNLTNRGIVGRGPYRWVRHPAYTAKNAAWWIGALPILATAWGQGTSAFVYALAGMCGWTIIYYLRAITEERHLGRDPDYQAYCQRVRYRFIPGLY